MTMKKNYNLTKLLKPYSNKEMWVALNEENTKVVASGKTIKDLMKEVKEKHLKNFSIIQAIPDYSGFVPVD